MGSTSIQSELRAAAFARERERLEQAEERARRDEATRERTQEFWHSLSGRDFELKIAALFQALGYAVEVTPAVGDAGIDMVVSRAGSTRIAVQCKALKERLTRPSMQQFLGAMHDGGFDHGIMVALSGITEGAQNTANSNGIDVMDINDIVRMTEEITPRT